MSTHATAGDLCTDECRHLCPACENGYVEACEDLFTLPTGAVVACMADELLTVTDDVHWPERQDWGFLPTPPEGLRQ